MNPPPTLQRITTQLRRLSPETLRLCELRTKRAEIPAEFTWADAAELLRLELAMDAKTPAASTTETQR